MGAGVRSRKRITEEDLSHLAKIAKDDLKDLFHRKEPLGALYKNRLICIALCQGAALHYLNGRNGVNDFDVWAFFRAHPERPFPYRRNKAYDFGKAKFGISSDRPDFVGKRVDCLGRSIDVRGSESCKAALRRYFLEARTKSAKELAKKAAILIYPPKHSGKKVWPMDD